MIVCVCNNVSSKDIIKHLNENSSSDFECVKSSLSCCNQCEVCQHDIKDIINNLKVC